MKKYKYAKIGNPHGDILLFDLIPDLPLGEEDAVWVSHEICTPGGDTAYHYWTRLFRGSYHVPLEHLSQGMIVTIGIKKSDKRWKFELLDFDKAGLLFLPVYRHQTEKPDLKAIAAGDV